MTGSPFDQAPQQESAWRLYWELTRPFTLVAPALGIASGAITAWGASGAPEVSARAVVGVAVATLAAAFLNAGSNALNQVADERIDAVNKPERPIPSGRLARHHAFRFSVLCYLIAIIASFTVSAWTGLLFASGGALSIFYSVGPRTKRSWFLANLTIAAARGLFLKVAAWATVRPPDSSEPWLIGALFAAYTFGAINSKDFADVEGDLTHGIRTLVNTHGPKVAAWVSAPFFVLPFLCIPLLAEVGLLTGHGPSLLVLGVGLALWGAYSAWLSLSDPASLTRENHPSWRHMYMIMFAMQIGFAVAYLL